MTINELREQYTSKRIAKSEYIDRMYQYHDLLFEYSEQLGKTNIASIYIHDGQVIMEFRDSGIKFICKRNDKRLAPLDTLNFGDYESEELAMQLKLMNGCNTVFDVGANFGWYSMHVASAMPDAKIHSFEPFENTCCYLRKNVELNKLGNIQINNFGLSNSIGKQTFYVDPKLSVNASLTNLTDGDNVASLVCDFTTMDEYCNRVSSYPDFIKCDVEGAELLVYEGSKEVLMIGKPIVFSEMLRKWTAKFGYHPNNIIELFNGLGYGCFIIKGGCLEKILEVTEATIETNFVFLHLDKHSEKIRTLSM